MKQLFKRDMLFYHAGNKTRKKKNHHFIKFKVHYKILWFDQLYIFLRMEMISLYI